MSDDMTVLDGEGIVREAEREFLHNAEFSARVKLAVACVQSLTPEPLSDVQRHMVTLSAAVGLFLHGYEPGQRNHYSSGDS